MMNMQINQLVKTLLQKDSLEQCSLEELEQFADRHPYFGAAQLLLTKKLQTENSDRYDEQLQKTFLFFHNPLWVEHLLNETGNAEIIVPDKKEEETLVADTLSDPAVIEQKEVPLIPFVENNETKDEPSIVEIEQDLADEPKMPEAELSIGSEQIPPIAEQVEVPGIPSVENNETKEEPNLDEIKQDLLVEPTSKETDPIAIGLPVVEETAADPPVIEQIEVPLIPSFDTNEEEDVKIITETNQYRESEISPVGTEPSPIGLSDEAGTPPIEIPYLKDEQSHIGPIAAAGQNQENSVKEELVFEPYHTVDYFASQGIKFKEEEKPADNFGKQLKSFTDWLKTMKRLPVSEIAKQVEKKSAEKVQQVDQLAAHSLQDREVLTETMAEVWEKQGNNPKAIEIYTKLSLLDPSKSRYFAAKIEELKKIN